MILTRTMDRDSSTHSQAAEPVPEPSPEPIHSGPPPETDPPSSDEPETPSSAAEMILAQLESGRAEERRRLRLAAIAAVVFHAAFFFITFPDVSREPKYVGKPGKVFVMQQTRFKKPPAPKAAAKQEIPKKKAKKIPIPDPTPDEPEPIVVEEVDIPDLEPTDVEEVVFGIPEAPPGLAGNYGTGRFTGQAMQIGNGVEKPVAINKPRPNYTEEARQKRIQGVIILQGVVDENGDVRNLKVVKGLPLGLDEKALESVYQWKFKPAVFEGKPVAVHFYFNVNFSLQ